MNDATYNEFCTELENETLRQQQDLLEQVRLDTDALVVPCTGPIDKRAYDKAVATIQRVLDGWVRNRLLPVSTRIACAVGLLSACRKIQSCLVLVHDGHNCGPLQQEFDDLFLQVVAGARGVADTQEELDHAITEANAHIASVHYSDAICTVDKLGVYDIMVDNATTNQAEYGQLTRRVMRSIRSYCAVGCNNIHMRRHQRAACSVKAMGKCKQAQHLVRIANRPGFVEYFDDITSRTLEAARKLKQDWDYLK